MSDKYVKYVGPHDEVDAFPLSGGQVHAKKGERIQVTAEHFDELTGKSGGGNWEDASSGRSSGGKE